MLNRRQLRIKALESVYAYDKSLDKNIDFQISYFLKSNKQKNSCSFKSTRLLSILKKI